MGHWLEHGVKVFCLNAYHIFDMHFPSLLFFFKSNDQSCINSTCFFPSPNFSLFAYIFFFPFFFLNSWKIFLIIRQMMIISRRGYQNMYFPQRARTIICW